MAAKRSKKNAMPDMAAKLREKNTALVRKGTLGTELRLLASW